MENSPKCNLASCCRDVCSVAVGKMQMQNSRKNPVRNSHIIEIEFRELKVTKEFVSPNSEVRSWQILGILRQDPEERPRAKRLLAGSTWLQQFDIVERRATATVPLLKTENVLGNFLGNFLGMLRESLFRYAACCYAEMKRTRENFFYQRHLLKVKVI